MLLFVYKFVNILIYVLYRRQGKVFHLRIRRPTRNGIDGKPVKMYQLENGFYFDSLYNLIIHYKTNPLKSPVMPLLFMRLNILIGRIV